MCRSSILIRIQTKPEDVIEGIWGSFQQLTQNAEADPFLPHRLGVIPTMPSASIPTFPPPPHPRLGSSRHPDPGRTAVGRVDPGRRASEKSPIPAGMVPLPGGSITFPTGELEEASSGRPPTAFQSRAGSCSRLPRTAD